MKPIIYFLTTCLLLIATQVSGQLVTNLTPAAVTAPIGNTVDLQLKVTNFTNVNSLQFPITYNGTVLQFNSIDNSVLPGWASGNYNATTGKVTISWFADPGSYPNGFSVPDNSSIFTLHFTVLTNGSTTVNLANVPPGIEVIANNLPLQVNYQTGGSNVTGGSGGPGPLTGFKIIANTIYIPQGTIGCMPVTVNDFTTMSSMQYAMHWDKNVLEFDTTKAYNLPDLTAGSFGGNPANGLQLLGWTDPNPGAGGVTRANGTKIYDVCFTAIGPVGSKSLVTIDSIGFAPGSGGAEAYNAAGQNVWTSTSGVTDTIFVVAAPPPPNAVTFTADQDTVGTGGQACIDVTVDNFSSIISMQFGITYNATQLQYQSIQFNPNPLGLTTGNFNPNTPGQIVFTWNDPLAQGVTLPDNTVIFSVCFTAAAPTGTTSTVNFSSLSQPPLPIEIVKEPDGPVIPVFVNGHVYVSAAAPPDVVPVIKHACGGDNGSITANVINGTGSTYAWNGPNGNFSGGQTISNLAPGTYNVTVTLTGGSTATESNIVVESAPSITIPSPQVNITPVQCFGECNGAISLTVTGGTPAFTYDWDGPGTFDAATEDISGLCPGNYVLKVTDTKGCSITSQPFPVTQPLSALATTLVSSTNVTCVGSATGQATISVQGGTFPYSYAWKTAPGGQLVSTAKNPTSLPCGTYNVMVTDSRNCMATLSNPVIISCPQDPLTVATPVQKTDVVCWGYNTGSISLNISGGWSGNYDVAWTPQIPGGANPINIPGGSYTPTITDAGGCSIVLQPVDILQPPAVTDTPVVVQHIDCANDGDGSISIQVSGGNGGPYTVNWNGGLSGQTIGNLEGGNYTPTITDGAGCTAVLTTITVNEPNPIDTTNGVIVTPMPGTPGAISLDIIGGTGTLDIKWTGPNGFMSNTEDISNLASGEYVLMVTDDNNCVFTKTFKLQGALSATATTTPSCGNDGCVNITILGGTPPFLISWNGGSLPTNDFAVSICTFAPGLVTLTITDGASNAISLGPLNVLPLDAALASSTTSPPAGASSNGTITLEPIPLGTPLGYNWTGPNGFVSTSNPITSLDSGHYVVTITNQNSGCTSVYPFDLEREWPNLVFQSAPQINQPNCTYSIDGSITVVVQGGNPGPPSYTYSWTGPNGPISNNSATLSGIGVGNYSVTVTDIEGITLTSGNLSVTSESNLAVTNVNVLSNYGGFQVSGAEECDGIANVAFTGAVGATSILWNNNIATVLNNTLCAGQYSVVVTDALGCTSVWSGELTSPPGIALNSQVVNSVSCHSECDGVLRVLVSGGVSPYTAKWSTGQTDPIPASGGFTQAVNLCGGNYSVTITDNLGATKVYAVLLPDPAEIVIDFAQFIPMDFNSCDGELIATAPGAVDPVIYTWSSNLGHSGENQRAEGLCAGEVVTFVLYDANGCAGIGVDTLDFPPDGCLQVRPVLTPGQQDGNNDYVYITCIEAPNSIEIFNRWGQLVFETTNYDNETNNWKGTSKSGQPLAEGVYFFVLNYIHPVLGPQQRKGHINLLR